MMAFDHTRSGFPKPRNKRVLFGALACCWCIVFLALLIAAQPEPAGAIPLSQDPPTPTPSQTPAPVLDTSNAQTLVCGGVYSGATQTLTNNVGLYGCKPWWDESGKEAVYRLQLSASQKVTVTLLNATADLDLFLLRDTSPGSCVAGGDNYLAYQAEPREYLLSVDGYGGAQGGYTFRVDCPAEVQATSTPSFTPSPTPTATKTGTITPTVTVSPGTPLKRTYLPLIIRRPSGSDPIPVTFTLQDGLDGYAGTTDTTLNSWDPGTPYGGDKVLTLFYAHEAINRTQKAPVVRFDLALLPDEAIVQNATLRLYVPSTPLYDVRAQVHGLLRAWDESSATWELAAVDQPWAQPGASAVGLDRSYRINHEQRIVLGSRWYEFDVTELVQEWAQPDGAKHGFVISSLAGESEASVEVRFVSREGDQTFRPQLVVTYRLGGPPIGP